jgi:hypothetical protein
MHPLLNLFVLGGASWIRAERLRLRPIASPLSPSEVSALSPFFPESLLAGIVVAIEDHIPNPTFYADLATQGIPAPLDFTQMAGITFEDTVLISRSRAHADEVGRRSLLFHEAVHVAQYAHLGVDAFMERYVLGWAGANFSYRDIPLEVQAYDLQARFDASHPPFSVPDLVAQQFPREA